MNNPQERLHSLDALRAVALLLGVVLHGTMSYMPTLASVGWPIVDASRSEFLGFIFFLTHIFRMTVFFVIAGFFAHLLFHRHGARAFIRDRAKRVLVPTVFGWIVLVPAVIAIFVWAASNSGTPLQPPPQSSSAFAVPLIHLWFLYLLAIFYAVTLAARAIVSKVSAIRAAGDTALAWLMRSRLAALVLAMPLAACLAARARWSVFEGIPTPDQSLIPNLAAFVGYGVAFSFGWLLHRQQALLAGLERTWIGYTAAAIAMSAGLLFLGQDAELPAAVDAIAYATASWAWTFALIGIAMRFLSSHRPSVRYLADASYWVYLVHLPVVFALQELMSDWPLHWSVKFPLLLAFATALLLASYHYFVRRTAIGQWLNGKRHGPSRAPADAVPVSR